MRTKRSLLTRWITLRYALRGIAFVALITLPQTPVQAQWQKLASFGEQISSIYFMKGDCSASVGFVGTYGWTIHKTTDGGVSWKQVHSVSLPNFYISNFEFKDSLVGWCTIANQNNSTNVGDALWKTTDGGETWFSMNLPGLFGTVYYHAQSGKLYLTNWDPKNGRDIFSLDDGITWQHFTAGNDNPNAEHNGFAFANGNNGVLSALQGTGYYVTNDGGNTWSQISNTYNKTIQNGTTFTTDYEEGYQPHVIPCTSSYVLAEEGPGKFVRSDDGGMTWKVLSTNFYNSPPLTGDVAGDAQHFFVQTGRDVEESLDGGVTWSSVGGPGNDYDTRMATRGGFIFAGNIAGDLFRYQYGTSGKQLAQLAVSPDTLWFPSSLCSDLTKEISISAVMTCTDCSDSLRLASAQLSGSTFFAIKNAPDPARGITQMDSVVIDHRPAATSADTATLQLNFVQYGQVTTRTVVLIGNSIPRLDEHIGLETPTNSSSIHVNAGDDVHAEVVLRDPLSSASGLTTVALTIPYDSRAITKLSVTGMNGWSVASEQDLPDLIQLSFTSAAHAVLSNEIVADIAFNAVVGMVPRSYVSLSNVHLNPADPNFENCNVTGVGEPDTISIVVDNSCGDSTLRALMAGIPLTQILGVRPDPVQAGSTAKLTIDLQTLERENVTFSLIDVTGRTVLGPVAIAVAKGSSSVTLDVSQVDEGAYILTAETADSKLTRKIIVQAH